MHKKPSARVWFGGIGNRPNHEDSLFINWPSCPKLKGTEGQVFRTRIAYIGALYSKKRGPLTKGSFEGYYYQEMGSSEFLVYVVHSRYLAICHRGPNSYGDHVLLPLFNTCHVSHIARARLLRLFHASCVPRVPLPKNERLPACIVLALVDSPMPCAKCALHA